MEVIIILFKIRKDRSDSVAPPLERPRRPFRPERRYACM